MDTVTDVPALRAVLATAPRPVGLVPTMGALHAGHRSLVDRARAEARTVVASVFVNPLQFGPTEDLEAYPRDLDADARVLAEAGCDLLFAPSAADFTPPDRLTTVHVAGLGDRLEGAARPGHLDGVATIVTKLLSAARPDLAYFGEKDFQQLAVVRRLVTDLDLGVEVVGCPVVLADDGLALSSRNAYLTPQQRRDALALPAALRAGREAYRGGDAPRSRTALRRTLSDAPGVRPDYAEVVDPETLEPLEGVRPGRPAQAVLAAFVGATRLIDTARLDP